MRDTLYIVVALTGVLAAGSQSTADWCHDFTNNVFCDDFDRYCTDPPPAPADCPSGGTRSDAALRNVWNWTSFNWHTLSHDGVNMIVEEDTRILTTGVYGGRHANGGDEGSRLGQNTVDLTPYIQTVMPGYTMVNGSGSRPLELQFDMSGGIQTANGIMYSNGYMELSLGDDFNGTVDDDSQAPTDFVMVGDDDGTGCKDCYHACPPPQFSLHVAWPSICQQEFPRTAGPNPCPPLQTFVRTSLAIGALAMLDNNPCHCENPADQVPQNYHLSYFDGVKWRILKDGMGGPGSYGDFTLGDKYDTVVLTIKTVTVDIYHRGRVDGTWVESEAFGLPRYYAGPFNRLRAGTKEGCMLQSASYTCDNSYANGRKRPTRMGDARCDGGGWQTNKSKFVSFDSVRLSTNYPVPWGACCLNDATCIIATQSECQSLGGHFAGPYTSCGPFGARCCPYPFADADGDGDVDQDDFGAFQVCHTGPEGGVPAGCECFNRVTSTLEGIDAADFTAFAQCFSGANVPWSQGLTPLCTP